MNKTNFTAVTATLIFTLLIWSACKHQPQIAELSSGFPPEIETIFISKCATAGCHNSITASGGIRMDTWEELFKGGNNGAVVVPFRPDISSLVFFINTDSNKGPIAVPTMPLNSPRLSDAEFETIRSWIAMGAPNNLGDIPFSTEVESRQKIYLSQQACDEVGVIDMDSKVLMRSITVGTHPGTENPHTIKADGQGNFVYVCLAGGEVVQKIDTRTDAIVQTLNIGNGKWNALFISPNDQYLLVVDWQGLGQVVRIETSTMTEVGRYTTALIQFLNVPHGVASNKNFDTFYLTRQTGNSLIKFHISGAGQKLISLDGNPPQASISTHDPHEVAFTPDYSKYFVTCEKSNDVRVLDAATDSVIAIIPTGIKPQEFAFSRSQPYLFVSCSEDVNPNPLSKGSIYVINYQTLQVVTVIYGRMYQPHGLVVDDKNALLMVASRNFDGGGPAPHHSSGCGGRNGYYTFYDLQSFAPFQNGRKFEVLPDPYSADIRFK